MPLISCSSQPRKTLEEFYKEVSSESEVYSKEIGISMLSILAIINNTFKETNIYGLTSHYHLVLLSKDTYDSDWFVRILASKNNFHIEYLLPKDDSPWPYAMVTGTSVDMTDFKKYLIIVMKKCSAWKDSKELLFDKIN